LCSRCHDDVRPKPDKLHREGGEAIGLALRPPPLHRKVAAVNVTKVTQPLPKPVPRRVVLVAEDAEPVHLPSLLRLDGARRGDGTGQRGQQEAAAVHYSMT
jgi:hypothetical protein